jgi:hypothetical protein
MMMVELTTKPTALHLIADLGSRSPFVDIAYRLIAFSPALQSMCACSEQQA